jgi:transcriptional regulator with PAS, ATPase and Fis domain
MPEHLLESELFGYEGGAFTGAKKEGKQGLFELAHRGTIFLDEIGDIPQSLQARLLRVLQEKEIMRVGGDKIVSVDIRIISATNKALELKVKQGGFRDDLYYRLNVFNLKIPPLRDRKSDILLLARNFLSRMDAALELDAAAPAMTQLLLNYDWPGNVRELHNVMERLALLASQPGSALRWEKMLHQAMLAPAANESLFNVRVDLGKGLKCALDQTEKSLIEIMMARHDQNQDIVAKKLGIGRTTLWRKSRS